MGIINFGIPKNTAEFLKKQMSLEIFVEGGTYQGMTASLMSKSFKKVYTIEKSNEMYNIAKNNLKGIKNIELLEGDTRDYLKKIMNNDNLLFWLDAHWSGGLTYGKEDESPLIKELEIIFSRNRNYAILIDDARLFLALPPKPHNFHKWPSLKDIMMTMPKDWEILVYKDVIYLLPEKIVSNFKGFIQLAITKEWEKSSRKKSIFPKILSKFSFMKC